VRTGTSAHRTDVHLAAFTGGRVISSQPKRRTRRFLLTGPTAGKGPPDEKDGSGDVPARHTHAWVRMDASGLIRFVGRQAELLFGYDGDDLGGQPIEMLIPEPVCKIYQEHRQDSRPGPGPVPGAWIWCEADGGGTGTGSLRASTCPTLTPGTACR